MHRFIVTFSRSINRPASTIPYARTATSISEKRVAAYVPSLPPILHPCRVQEPKRGNGKNRGQFNSQEGRLIFVRGVRASLKATRHKTAKTRRAGTRVNAAKVEKPRESPRVALIPVSSSPMLTHLDNGDEAIIFSAPEARYVSMRIKLTDLMRIPIASDLLPTSLRAPILPFPTLAKITPFVRDSSESFSPLRFASFRSPGQPD